MSLELTIADGDDAAVSTVVIGAIGSIDTVVNSSRTFVDVDTGGTVGIEFVAGWTVWLHANSRVDFIADCGSPFVVVVDVGKVAFKVAGWTVLPGREVNSDGGVKIDPASFDVGIAYSDPIRSLTHFFKSGVVLGSFWNRKCESVSLGAAIKGVREG